MSIAVLWAAPVRADEAAVLYDPATVTTVDLALSDASKQALRDAPKTYTDATLTLTAGGQRIGPYAVGVKLKGTGSFRTIDSKAGFRLKFAHSVKGQKILGLKGMTLNNMVQDESMVHETFSYGVFRAANVPAPRTGYAYVRVNDEPFGFYLDLEPYDTVSLARLFTSTKHLYEATISADLEPGKRDYFEVDEGSETDKTDLEGLIAAASGSGWAAKLDLAEMTRMWATESFVGHWDGYSVAGQTNPDLSYLPNNYYLHDGSDGVFRMLPWGTDSTLETGNRYIGEGRSVLFKRCKGETACFNDYRAALRSVSATYASMGAGTQLGTAMETVARWRTCAAREQPTDAEYRAVTEDTRTFLRNRRADIATYLGDAAPPATTLPPVPAKSTAACPAPPLLAATPQPSPSPAPEPQPSAAPVGPPPPSDPSPAPEPSVTPAATTTPVACRVPALAGHTLAAARRRLRVAHCAGGKVVRRARPARGRWRVKTTRPGRGAQRPAGTKVVIVLARKR